MALLALGFAATAQAGLQLYTGSLTYHAFGNDTTTGSTPKVSKAGFEAFPWTVNCLVGAFHAKETVTFPTSSKGSGTIMFTLPNYGGQALVHDTNSDGFLDKALGCLDSSVEVGAPMYGQGLALSTTGMSSTSRTPANPRGIDIPTGRFTAMHDGTGSLQSYGPYAFDVQYTDLSNESGSFRKDGGIGNFTWTERTGMDPPGFVKHGKVVINQGPNKFGGTMKMLGTFYSNEGFYYKGHLSVAKYTWLFQYHGAGAITWSDMVTQPGIVTERNTIFTTIDGNQYDSRVFGKMFSWTTGTVSVTATHGPFPTVLARHGFDNRNAAGSGEIQMVTPMITRWVWLSGNYETASIGHLKLNLTPEPREWMMLGAGISLLGLLYRSNRRSH